MPALDKLEAVTRALGIRGKFSGVLACLIAAAGFYQDGADDLIVISCILTGGILALAIAWEDRAKHQNNGGAEHPPE